MPYRNIKFANDRYYHLFNRGVEKRNIFSSKEDYQHFLETLFYYQFGNPKPSLSTHRRFKLVNFENNQKIVEINAYCLMPNHFHLLIKQLDDKGIQEFARKALNSYTKYFNTKNNRVGHLFQGTFKAVPVETDQQLIHLSRYIHLNPFVANLVAKPENYEFSSLQEYFGDLANKLCKTEVILDQFRNKEDYQKFILDYQDYAKEFAEIKNLTLEK